MVPRATELRQRGRSPRSRPGGAPIQLRAAWRLRLRERTSTIAHDAFTLAGLGHHIARVNRALAALTGEVGSQPGGGTTSSWIRDRTALRAAWCVTVATSQVSLRGL